MHSNNMLIHLKVAVNGPAVLFHLTPADDSQYSDEIKRLYVQYSDVPYFHGSTDINKRGKLTANAIFLTTNGLSNILSQVLLQISVFDAPRDLHAVQGQSSSYQVIAVFYCTCMDSLKCFRR